DGLEIRVDSCDHPRAVFLSGSAHPSCRALARVNRPGDHLAFPRGLPDRAIARDGTGEQRVTGRPCERECATASRRGIFFSRNRTDPWSGRMPNYLSPGVYVEEVSSGSKPIEGVGTAVAAFVGFAERGPVNTPTLVTNWTQYTQNFGEFIEGSYLAHSVYGYFLNGGGAAYVVRVGANGSNGAKVARAELPAGQEAAKPPFAARA